MNLDEQKDHPVCIRCGRKLKSPEARLLGFGKICWQKHLASPKVKPLFEVKKSG